MNKSNKNTRKQIEILKAQLASQKVKPVQKRVSNKIDTSNYSEELIDPKFYKSSLLKTLNLTFVIVILVLLLFLFQNKWVKLFGLTF